MNVALTGFMGAGKSTVGRRLARILGLPFVDADAQIEREHGSIAEIFARDGEAQFRRLESSVLERLASAGPQVIAVGGGAVLDPRNRRLLRRNGVIVHLAISPQAAYRRVAHRSHRPMLGPRPDLATIEKLLAARRPAYSDNDLEVTVDGRSPSALAHVIARWYRRQVEERT